MKKIKLSFPYPELSLTEQCPKGVALWDNYKFFINPPNTEELDFDYWFVYNFPVNNAEKSFCRKGGLVLITAEPDSVQTYSNQYVKQFDYVITCQRNLRHPNKILLPQGLPWRVRKSYDELVVQEPISKQRKISIVSSNKVRTIGHRRRLDFTLKIKEYFKDKIDLYGKGLNDFVDKWETVAPYMYSIAIENSAQNFYFTEKILDCYLSFTYPIYYGCLNIEDFFDKRSYVSIDINKFDSAVKRIEALLEDPNHYADNLKHLISARNKVLNDYNVFPLIVNFILNFIEKDNRDNSFIERQVKWTEANKGFLHRMMDKIH